MNRYCMYFHIGIGKEYEGKEIPVTVFSNCEQVELFLNNKSLGKQSMPINGHIEWKVLYQPGVLMAKGYNSGKEILTDKVQTTSDAATLQLSAGRTAINADGEDVSVITVQVNDKNDLFVPTADNLISFTLDGPGKIIGVGNGDPTSHEADRFFEIVKTAKIGNLKELAVNNLVDRPETVAGFNDSTWKPALRSQRSDDWRVYIDTLLVIRGTFEIPDFTNESEINLFTKSIVENQSIYVNRHLLERILNAMLRINHIDLSIPSLSPERMNMP